jgi:hypothetical protein
VTATLPVIEPNGNGIKAVSGSMRPSRLYLLDTIQPGCSAVLTHFAPSVVRLVISRHSARHPALVKMALCDCGAL